MVYRQTVEPYPKIELSARDRAELVAVLDNVGTYYDWPGVIACVCDRRNEVVLELHLKERDLEASFCSTCQRIYSWGPEADELNLPLSEKGTKVLQEFFERVLRASALRRARLPRPSEDLLQMPPNGTWASPPGVPLLTWTMPASMPSTKRKAVVVSLVKMDDDRP